MYKHQDSSADLAKRWAPDGLKRISPATRAQYAIDRVRQALSGEVSGEVLDQEQLQRALAVPLTEPGREAERCFALGWLRWLCGYPGETVPLLVRAVELLPAKSPEQVQAAYWLARAR